MKLINDHISSGLSDSEILLENLSKKQEEDQDSIKELQETIDELGGLLLKVQEIKKTLEAQIKINEELNAASKHRN